MIVKQTETWVKALPQPMYMHWKGLSFVWVRTCCCSWDSYKQSTGWVNVFIRNSSLLSSNFTTLSLQLRTILLKDPFFSYIKRQQNSMKKIYQKNGNLPLKTRKFMQIHKNNDSLGNKALHRFSKQNTDWRTLVLVNDQRTDVLEHHVKLVRCTILLTTQTKHRPM